MGQLITPGDAEAAAAVANSPELQAAMTIVQNLGPLLQAISNQLDLLIRIECGHVKRAEMRERFEMYEAQQAALVAANGHGT